MQWVANFLHFHKYSILKRKEWNRAQAAAHALLQKLKQDSQYQTNVCKMKTEKKTGEEGGGVEVWH
jgi:hypothetical protein